MKPQHEIDNYNRARSEERFAFMATLLFLGIGLGTFACAVLILYAICRIIFGGC